MKEPKPGEQSREEKGEISSSDKEILDVSFRDYFLDDDVINSLAPAAFSAMAGQFETIQPIQAYEEYVREVAYRRTGKGEAKAYYDYIMDRSDSRRVAQYNEMIKMFNNNLENIKRDKDNRKVQEFFQKATEFLKTKREERNQ
ncbi:MAG TPA: hypothetical protein VMV71_00755 [Candidatus Paceibacterota bacterium]|nr:hypothetical protein [Candidatus Paceibacterota bacterium]